MPTVDISASMAKMYSSGMTGAEIATITGYGQHTVMRLVKKSGCAIRPRGKRHVEFPPAAELWAMYSGGMTQSAMAAKFGRNKRCIYKALKAAGYPMNKVYPTARQEPEVEKGYRRCTVCRTVYSLTSYSPKSYLCKLCSAAAGRKSAIKSNHGITLAQFHELAAAQGNKCSICSSTYSRSRTGTAQRLVVDHCHATGEIRGLLCSPCNCALGMLRDSPATVDAAAAYLRGNRPPIGIYTQSSM